MATHPNINAARTAYEAAADALHVRKQEALAADHRAWLLEGGCRRCSGHGRIVDHYSDGDSFDRGLCPGYLVGETLLSRWQIDHEAQHGSRSETLSSTMETYAGSVCITDAGDVVVTAAIECTARTVGALRHTTAPEFDELSATVTDTWERFKHELSATVTDTWERFKQAEKDWTPHVGALVVVARGRKVAKGTRGRIVTLVDGQWGTRALVAAPTGDVWVAVDNVDVVTPSVPLPPLWGSDRQVSWAARIRHDAIDGGLTGPDLERHDARWWIENRERWSRQPAAT